MGPSEDFHIVLVYHGELKLQSLYVRAPEGPLQLFQVEIGYADMADASFFLQPVQGSESLFVGNDRIGPVHDHQIYIVSSEVPEGFFALLQDQVSPARADILAVNKGVGAFGGDKDTASYAFPHIFQSLSDIPLCSSCIVGRGCIYKVDAAFHGGRDGVQPGFI